MIAQANLEALYPGKIVTIVDDTVKIFDPETAEETTESFQSLKERIKQEQGTPNEEELDP